MNNEDIQQEIDALMNKKWELDQYEPHDQDAIVRRNNKIEEIEEEINELRSQLTEEKDDDDDDCWF